jgi:hypothetical protein
VLSRFCQRRRKKALGSLALGLAQTCFDTPKHPCPTLFLTIGTLKPNNFAGSYRIYRILQLHGAVGVSKVKAFTTINTLSLIDSLNTHEIIDQQYLMLEVPVYLRIHLRQNRPQKYGMHLFLELGLVYYTPIVNKSNYQRSENGVPIDSKSIGMRGLTRTGGIGLASGTRNTLAFNFGSYKNQMRKFSSIQRLTFTHFFDFRKKDTDSLGE